MAVSPIPRSHLPALAVAACVLAMPVAEAQAAERPVLERGDRGKSVRKLQRALGLNADGIFGPGTERAVKRFQRRNGMEADGVVGAATWGALAPRLARRASRAGGGSGGSRSGVRALQRALGIAADGVFGPGTESAVKSYQQGHGMTADGIVGPATRSALGLGPGPILRRGRRTRSGLPPAVAAAIRAANRIHAKPYLWGGGHGQWRDTGYDCSGSVSYVLHAAGVLARPRDSSGLMSWGRPGRGRYITVYSHPGHVFMVIRGRRFDTTGRSSTGSRWQPSMRSTAGYTVRHPAGL